MHPARGHEGRPCLPGQGVRREGAGPRRILDHAPERPRDGDRGRDREEGAGGHPEPALQERRRRDSRGAQFRHPAHQEGSEGLQERGALQDDDIPQARPPGLLGPAARLICYPLETAKSPFSSGSFWLFSSDYLWLESPDSNTALVLCSRACLRYICRGMARGISEDLGCISAPPLDFCSPLPSGTDAASAVCTKRHACHAGFRLPCSAFRLTSEPGTDRRRMIAMQKADPVGFSWVPEWG